MKIYDYKEIQLEEMDDEILVNAMENMLYVGIHNDLTDTERKILYDLKKRDIICMNNEL